MRLNPHIAPRARPAQFATATIIKFANELQTKLMKFVNRKSGLVQYAG